MTNEIAIERWTKLVEQGQRLGTTKGSSPEIERWKDNVRTAIVRTLPGRSDLLTRFDGIRSTVATVHRTDREKQIEAHRRAMATMLAFAQSRLDEIEKYGIEELPTAPAPGIGPNPKRAFLIDLRPQGDDVRDRLVRLGITPMEWAAATREIGRPDPPVREIVALGAKRSGAVVVVLSGDVAFEAGIAIGAAPEKTVLLAIGDSFEGTDLGGHPVVRFDGLAAALKAAGCTVEPTPAPVA